MKIIKNDGKHHKIIKLMNSINIIINLLAIFAFCLPCDYLLLAPGLNQRSCQVARAISCSIASKRRRHPLRHHFCRAA